MAVLATVSPILFTAAHSQLAKRFWQLEETTFGWFDSVKQTLSYSCGPALIASRANSFSAEHSEFDFVGKAEIQQGGITLAEFRRLALDIGWQGNWFSGVSESLNATGLPVAVHFNEPDDHFVLVHHLLDSHVVIEDPVIGLMNISRSSFENRWSGYFYANFAY